MTDLGVSSEFGHAEEAGLPEHFYFHVPFCRSKCSYCDFTSYAGSDSQDVFAVFAGMEAEVHRWSFASLPGVVATVYVGGGTPSLHAAPVGQLLEQVRRHLPLRSDAEITVEANPDSLSSSALEALVAGGATRISVGVQAFDDGVLRLLGRLHDSRQARVALSLVREAGIELSVDLICGVPGQSMASWVESLEQALDSGAKHLSIYPLAIEDGTALSVAISGGLVVEPDPDTAAEMMLVAQTRLAASGIERYEVANYATPGHESIHNTAYWTGKPYVGVGPGAHGMFEPGTAQTVGMYFGDSAQQDVARVRYANSGEIDAWLTGAAPQVELLSADEVAKEDVMLGLRLVRGVRVSQVSAARLDDVLDSLRHDGLTELVDGHWRTTERGWLLGNVVFGRVWAGE
ncbi:MAG: radical SAM family heme chaperone HemW [Coriobacteriia bacterium]|nr:radical SAM family heme chaperone HemW [Coriobacteriia bacterium]